MSNRNLYFFIGFIIFIVVFFGDRWFRKFFFCEIFREAHNKLGLEKSISCKTF